MRRVAFAVLFPCLIAFASLLTGPARAGDYSRYDEGFSYHAYPRNVRVWYSTSCCYRRIVRHQTTVRYIPLERHGYYDQRYREGYYEHPYRDRFYGRRYSDYPYYRSYTVSRWHGGYSEGCYARRVRVTDAYGGWLWSVRRVCD